jgi:hypothetical protein
LKHVTTYDLFPFFIKKSRIININKNMYMVSQRMKMYLIDFFFFPKFLVSHLCHMWLVQHDYEDFSYKCHIQLKINRNNQLQNDHFLLMTLVTFNYKRLTSYHTTFFTTFQFTTLNHHILNLNRKPTQNKWKQTQKQSLMRENTLYNYQEIMPDIYTPLMKT